MRRNAKTDANQAAIVSALRQIGATVVDLSAVGQGCPDILVGYRGHNWLLEIKGPKGKTNALQDKWHSAWEGQATIVRTPEEAIELVAI